MPRRRPLGRRFVVHRTAGPHILVRAITTEHACARMPDALNPIHVLTCLMCGKLADTSAAPIPTPVAVAAAALAAATLAAALAATSVVVCALSPPPPSLGGQDFGPVPRRRPFGQRSVLQPTVGPPIQVAAATNEFSSLAAAALTTPEFAALAAATVAAAASTPP